jgi:hypothetical protein
MRHLLEYIKEGFRGAVRQSFLLSVLFVYQLVWGIVLYKLISSVVLPLLHRYPGDSLDQGGVHLFLAESQFRLLKTDVTHPYLWLLLAILLMRMAFTPLLNAGVYFSLHHTEYNAGYRFARGIKELAAPFLLYYIVQMLLTAAPLYWIAPKVKQLFLHSVSYENMMLQLAPYLIGYWVYVYLIELIFTYVMIGKTTDNRPAKSAPFLVRYCLPVATMTLAMLLLTGLLSLVVAAASLIWAGFLALVLYQAYRFCKVFCDLWLLSSQYRIWMAKVR